MGNKRLLCMAIVCALSTDLVAEVQVNVRTSGSQANPAVIVGATGGVTIVWSSYYSSAGRSNDILARRLDPLGNFTGNEFQVNVMSGGNQTEPAVAADDRGGFAVAWQGPGLDQDDIFLRRFDPNGKPTTDEMLMNSHTTGRQLYPSVAMNDVAIILAWESREIVEDVNRTSVRVQVFEPNGAALGGEITPDAVAYDGRYPEVATDSSGRFVVVWMQERSGHPIMARLFDPNGAPTGEPFQVTTEAVASLTRPSIAMNSLGFFVVAWDGDPNRASDDDIHARFYDRHGVPTGEPFIVNTIRTGAQQWPQVAINDANEFVVVWQHETGDPNAATDIFARQFDGEGQPVSDQSQLNTYVQGKQRYPDAGVTADGAFIATWESEGQDGASYGVFAHIAAPTIPPDPNKAAP